MIVLGDFNLNWLTNVPNLKNISQSTLIDLILSTRSDKIVASGVFDFGINDHCPIACIRNT